MKSHHCPSPAPLSVTSSSVVQRERGASMVEFAMTVVVFMLFIIGGIDIICFGYVSVTVQHVLSRAARDAIVGTAGDVAILSHKTGPERAVDIADNIYRIGDNFALNLRDATIKICPIQEGAETELPNCSPNDAGEARNFIKIYLERPYHFMWGAFNYNIVRTVVAKNEPF